MIGSMPCRVTAARGECDYAVDENERPGRRSGLRVRLADERLADRWRYDRVLDVELTTAHELSDAEFDRILGQIEQASGRKVKASRTVNPDLIGGIVLQAGSMRLDASVRGRLERLRQTLATTRS